MHGQNLENDWKKQVHGGTDLLTVSPATALYACAIRTTSPSSRPASGSSLHKLVTYSNTRRSMRDSKTQARTPHMLRLSMNKSCQVVPKTCVQMWWTLFKFQMHIYTNAKGRNVCWNEYSQIIEGADLGYSGKSLMLASNVSAEATLSRETEY